MGETREAIVYRLSEDMLSKLPPNYVAHEVSYTLPCPQCTGAVCGFHKAELSPQRACFSPFPSLLIPSSLSAGPFSPLVFSSLPFSSILQIMICNFSDTFFHFLSAALFLSIAFSVPFSHLWIPRYLNPLDWKPLLPSLTQACSVHPLNLPLVLAPCPLQFPFSSPLSQVRGKQAI